MIIQPPFDSLKVALVYDHLTTSFGGAELVLQQLVTLFPLATIYTSVADSNATKIFSKKQVKTSFLQHTGFLKRLHQILAPLHPMAFESLNLQGYDLIISVSNGASKGVLTHPGQLHICYLLTPTRYLYQNSSDQNQYLDSQGVFKLPAIRALTKPLFGYLRRWDAVAAWRPDRVIAISELVAQRSKKFYHREVDSIVYPPFNHLIQATDLSKASTPYYLCLSRLVSYKKIEVAIAAALKTNNILIIAGTGIYADTLKSVANNKSYTRKQGDSVETCLRNAVSTNKQIIFWGQASEAEKALLLTQAQALLMPGLEDFGLVGLEAASVGTPVITYSKSGIAEVLGGTTGCVLIHEQTAEELSKALLNLTKNKADSKKLIQIAESYHSTHFLRRFSKTIYQFWQQHSTISSVQSASEYHTK